MITAPFDYEAPDSIDEAVRMLHDNGEDAKLLAGGHSLLPLMKVRLAAPTILIDLRNISGLHGISQYDGDWQIGSMTRHSDIQDLPEMGVASRAASLIADQQVRNRGTIGGSIAHADPASDLPTVVLALDGTITAQGIAGEKRTIAAADMFQDYLTTALEHTEVITQIAIPRLDDWGFGYQKFTRRAEDWAMVGVCALVKKGAGGECEDVRVGLTHMGPTPLRASAVEDALRGGGLDAESIAAAAAHASDGTDPPGDLNATPDYKRHLAAVLTRRALEEAVAP